MELEKNIFPVLKLLLAYYDAPNKHEIQVLDRDALIIYKHVIVLSE